MNHNDCQEKISATDPFVRSFLSRIPPPTAASFTDSQLTELQRVFKGRVQSQHYVDIRLSLPIFKERFYLVFLMGKENRRIKRLQNHIGKPANKTLLRLSGLVIITSLVFTLYMVNQLWGNSHFPKREVQKSVQLLNESN